jgi:hypothetical protein
MVDAHSTKDTTATRSREKRSKRGGWGERRTKTRKEEGAEMAFFLGYMEGYISLTV